MQVQDFKAMNLIIECSSDSFSEPDVVMYHKWSVCVCVCRLTFQSVKTMTGESDEILRMTL